MILLLLLGSEPPLVGRPVEWPFTGAVAGFARTPEGFAAPFTVTSSVSVEIVEARQAVTLVLVAQALGPVKVPPSRPDLRELPTFTLHFGVEEAGGREASGSRWEWRWKLRPKDEEVSGVPGVPFLYYNPDIKPRERGYQLLWTDPHPLKVEKAEEDKPPPKVPGEMAEIPSDEGAWEWPWLLSLLAPPALCIAWWIWWHRTWPDAARLARLREGRAARRALSALERLRGDARQRAEGIVQALTLYLRERLGAGSANPTPDEARAILSHLPELAERLRTLWIRLDAVRFGPSDVVAESEARSLVADLEEALCSS